MNKIGRILLLTLLLAAAFTGCTDNQVKTTTITVWHYYSAGIKTQFDALVQQFNETAGREKGISVNAYSQGGVNELANAVFAAANKDIGASSMPDIFAAYSDNVYRLNELGAVASLDPYFTQKELAEYRSEFLEDGRFGADGTLKIIPIAKSTELLYLNASVFDEFAGQTGASYADLETWEGLVKTAELYYSWSGGEALFGMDSMANFMIICTKQLGKDIFTVDGNTVSFNLSLEDAKKIWDVCYVPYMKGYYTSVGRFRSDDVKIGAIVMFTGANSSASFFPRFIETGKNASHPVSSQVLPFPHFAGSPKYAIHQGAGMVVVKKDAKTERACAEFLKWLTAPEQNLAFAVSTAYLPVTNKALSYETTINLLGTDDEGDVRVQTAKAVYDMLDTYILYAGKPFQNSFEARNILNNSLTNQIKEDMKKLEEQAAAGKSREELLNSFTGEAHFIHWYTQLASDLAPLLR